MCNVKMLVVAAFVFGFAACKKKEQSVGTQELESATATESPTMGAGAAGAKSDAPTVADDAGAQPGKAAMAHQAGNCPSTVLGATTTAQVKAKAVVVTVSSKDKDAIAAIQKRAEEMLKVRLDGKVAEGHDRQGTHGGKTGVCPIVLPEGAKATAKNDKAGVVITITPVDKVDDLKTAIDERIAKAAQWVKENIEAGDQGNSGGVGGGEGKDGSNHSGKGDGKGRERKAASEPTG